MSTRRGDVEERLTAPDHDLYETLGLDPSTTADDVRAACEEMESFLATAPEHLRPWATEQLAAAREIRARLDEREAASEGIEDAGSPQPADLGDLDATHFDEDDFDLDPVERARETKRPRRRPRAARPATKTTVVAAPAAEPEIIRPYGAGRRRPLAYGEMPRPVTTTTGGGRSNLLVPILAMLLVIAVVYGVYATGRPAPAASANPTAAASTAAPQLDEARVKELSDKVAADPKDVVSLRGLTDEYYAAEQYDKAAQWQQKVVDLQPNDVTSRLVLAAALANSGDATKAEAEWTKVTQLDPKQQEAWYNLGILHFSSEPPQEDKARAEWAKVLEIDPNSELGKNVSNHLTRLPSSTATAAATAPATAPGAASTATTAAPSAAAWAPTGK